MHLWDGAVVEVREHDGTGTDDGSPDVESGSDTGGSGAMVEECTDAETLYDTDDDFSEGDGQMHGRSIPPTRSSAAAASSSILAALH